MTWDYVPEISWQRDVHNFMLAMGQKIGDYSDPKLADIDLRVDLILEEADELVSALHNNDLVEAVDGMVDLIYVVLGTAVAAGIDLDFAWDEIHESNMAKAEGPVGDNGKRLKPKNWAAPDVQAAINRGREYSRRLTQWWDREEEREKEVMVEHG